MPQIVNALLSRHNFILLGLRGQAKSRILRALDDAARRRDADRRRQRGERQSVRADLEVRAQPASTKRGDDTPIAWVERDSRFVEKLATPDVTIADIIGDVDPIKAARGGHMLSDELTIHYGMLPRANRGIFALNELPDLAGKVQVGLFNIMQEGDVQIKGYPVRLPLDVLLCFTANPEDYTARGKIITPLKDRIGSEIKTHYPETRRARHGDHAAGGVDRARRPCRCAFPTSSPRSSSASRSRRATTSASTSAPACRSACRSRVMENVVSNAERRALRHRRARRSCRASPTSTPRCRRSPARSSSSTRASWSAGTTIARELIRRAADATFQERAGGVNTDEIVMWFDEGGALQVDRRRARRRACATGFETVPGLLEHRAPRRARAGRRRAADGRRVRAGARGARRAQEDLALRRRAVRPRRARAAPPARTRISSAAACRPERDDARSLADARLRGARPPRVPRVRPATPRDLDAVVALRLALLREHADHPIYGRLRPTPTRRARELFAAQLASRRRGDLPRRAAAARWSASCAASSRSARRCSSRRATAYVSSVYVRPDVRAPRRAARAAGRGRALVRATRARRDAAAQRRPAARPPSARGTRSASRSSSRSRRRARLHRR